MSSKAMWLQDKDGNAIIPKTFESQVYDNDNNSLSLKLAEMNSNIDSLSTRATTSEENISGLTTNVNAHATVLEEHSESIDVLNNMMGLKVSFDMFEDGSWYSEIVETPQGQTRLSNKKFFAKGHKYRIQFKTYSCSYAPQVHFGVAPFSEHPDKEYTDGFTTTHEYVLDATDDDYTMYFYVNPQGADQNGKIFDSVIKEIISHMTISCLDEVALLEEKFSAKEELLDTKDKLMIYRTDLTPGFYDEDWSLIYTIEEYNAIYGSVTHVTFDSSNIDNTMMNNIFGVLPMLRNIVFRDSHPIFGGGAFAGITSNGQPIRNIIVYTGSMGVVTISENSFKNCKNLKNIVVNSPDPDDASGIKIDITGASEAFCNCTNLESIYLVKDKTTSLVDMSSCFMTTSDDSTEITLRKMFYNCRKLSRLPLIFMGGLFGTSLNMDISISMMEGAFTNCHSLTCLEFYGVASIEGLSSAISPGCETFKGVEEVRMICGDTFDTTSLPTTEGYVKCGARGFNSYRLHGTQYMPYECSAQNELSGIVGEQESITISGVMKVTTGAFANHTWIKEINFPASIYQIEAEAFANCIGVDDIDIPPIPMIGDNAFKNVKHISYTGPATGAPWGALSYN